MVTKSPAHRAHGRIQNQFEPQRLLSALTIGLIVGLLEIFLTLSFAALIYTGPLAAFVASGVAFGLLGAALCGILVAAFTSLPGTVGGNQDTPAAIMAIMVAGIVAALPAGVSEQTLFATVALTIALTTMLTGLCFFLLGAFSLGSLVRYLPYPVVGGFLAGTGWLLLTGAVGLATNAPLTWASLAQPEMLVRWLPGLLLSLLLLFLLERFSHFLILPGVLLAAMALFYAVTAVAGLPVEQLSAMGWLLGPFPADGLWQLPPWGDLGRVSWAGVWGELPNVAGIVLLSTVALLLNVTGLELMMEKDCSLNQDLRAAGIGNILAGLSGGFIGYQQLSLSSLEIRVGGGSRLTGIVAAAVCLAALFFGAAFLSLFPRLVIAGLVGYLGLTFLKEWVVDAWFRLPRIEYAIVLFILIVIAAVGFLEGVTVGVVAAVVLFVVAYSRTEVVRQALSGAALRSRVRRPTAVRRLLQEAGDHLFVLRLQGFIFFGTADKLAAEVKARLADVARPPLRFLLLDFRRVTGLDSTAVLSLRKLKQAADKNRVTLVITEARPTVLQQLHTGLLTAENGVRVFADMDQGLAWCEEQLLAQETLPAATETLAAQLHAILPDQTAVQALLPHLTRVALTPGMSLMAEGDPPDNLYFIESGQVTAQTAVAGRAPLRLETMGAGHVVGELGFYLDQARTASVVVDEAGVAYRLTRADLLHIEREHPAAAAALHRLMVNLLANRVTHLVTAINALEQ